MADVAVVTIAGQPVEGGRYGEHRWRTCLGLQAPLVEWRLPPTLAALVLSKRETDITITPPGGRTDTYHVVVVGEGPCDDPYARTVILSDTRWYLTFVNLIWAYNRRVPSGTGHLVASSGLPVSRDSITSDVTYAYSSLRLDGSANPQPWKANEILDDIFTAAQKAVKAAGMPGLLVWTHEESNTRGQWVPNDVMGDAAANVALAQVLGQLGGLDVRCEPDGSLAIVDGYLGAEKNMVTSNVTYSLDGKGVLKWISMAPLCPKKFVVKYTRLLEVRADAKDDYSGASAVDLTNSDAPWAENVVQVVEPISMATTEHGEAIVAVAGTYLSVPGWFLGVRNANDAPSNATQSFTVQNVLTYWFQGVLEDQFVTNNNDGLSADEIWAQRIAQIKSDLRTTYRLNPRFASRCVPGSIRAERAALLNQATGQKSATPAWRDHYRFYSRRGLSTQRRYGYNVAGVPPLGVSSAPGTSRTYGDTSFPDQPFALNLAQPAPFVVSCQDTVHGRFRVEPRPDPQGRTSLVLPGLLQKTPGVNPWEAAQGQVPPLLEYCPLLFSDRVAFIFSATPVGAYGSSQTHDYEVDAVTALARLGVDVNAVTPQGPNRDLRIGDAVALARFAWSDNARADILTCFNRNAGGNPSNLVPVNDNILNDFAIATAATVIAATLDHFEGTATIGYTPALKPVGSLGSVDHFVTEDGRLYTTAHCAFVQPSFKPEQFMSQASRFAIFGNLGDRGTS